MLIHDLSMPLERDHFRWPAPRRETGDWSVTAPFRVTKLDLSCHAFTHVDAPRHMLPEGHTIDETPLEHLAAPAFILDLRDIDPGEEIDADRIDTALAGRKDEPILLLSARWDEDRDWRTPGYWRDAPYLSREAAERLAEERPKAVAFDFPQDYTIRLSLDGIVPPIEEHVTHEVLLRRGIALIEYLINTAAIRSSRVVLSALPVKIAGADGAPARVVAFEEFGPG